MINDEFVSKPGSKGIKKMVARFGTLNAYRGKLLSPRVRMALFFECGGIYADVAPYLSPGISERALRNWATPGSVGESLTKTQARWVREWLDEAGWIMAPMKRRQRVTRSLTEDPICTIHTKTGDRLRAFRADGAISIVREVHASKRPGMSWRVAARITVSEDEARRLLSAAVPARGKRRGLVDAQV